MTLLLTEIFANSQSNNSHIVFAADGRLSIDGRPAGSRRKVLRYDSINCGVGYFGLASWPGDPDEIFLADLLADLEVELKVLSTLAERARRIAARLNQEVPARLRASEPLGVHFGGFESGRPEFWYVRNIPDPPASGVFEFFEEREDFQRRDAALVLPGHAWTYRNGDLRAHEAAWQHLDRAFGSLMSEPDFDRPVTEHEYVEWVRYKLEVIADFYEKFSRLSSIGRPIETFVLTG